MGKRPAPAWTEPRSRILDRRNSKSRARKRRRYDEACEGAKRPPLGPVAVFQATRALNRVAADEGVVTRGQAATKTAFKPARDGGGLECLGGQIGVARAAARFDELPASGRLRLAPIGVELAGSHSRGEAAGARRLSRGADVAAIMARQHSRHLRRGYRDHRAQTWHWRRRHMSPIQI